MIAPVSPISPEQIKAIRSMQRAIGLGDDDYRDMLQATAGVRSTRALSSLDAARIIEKLKPLAPLKPRAQGAATLTGPYAPVCRALWIAAHNLGLITVGTDKALLAFVQRQTHLAHLNWMRAPADAAKVIEALKAMIAKAADVTWDAPAVLLAGENLTLARWRKLEILRAQMRLLEQAGEHGPWPSLAARDAMSGHELDALSSELGRRLRAAKERRQSRPRFKAG